MEKVGWSHVQTHDHERVTQRTWLSRLELGVRRREMREYHGRFTHSFITHISSIQGRPGTGLG